MRRAAWMVCSVVWVVAGCGGSEEVMPYDGVPDPEDRAETDADGDTGDGDNGGDGNTPGDGDGDGDSDSGDGDSGDGDLADLEMMDGGTLEVIDSVEDLEGVLCNHNDSGPGLRTSGALNGSWEKHRGKSSQSFGGVMGYPCAGFALQDIPAQDDSGWAPADDPDNIGFSEPSTFCSLDAGVRHGIGEFTYFRSNVWIPPDTTTGTASAGMDAGVSSFKFASLVVRIVGIDDSVKLWVYNSKHPDGFTPRDDAACSGNGNFDYDFSAEVQSNEVNTIVMVHMDSECATSALEEASITVNGTPLEPIVQCN